MKKLIAICAVAALVLAGCAQTSTDNQNSGNNDSSINVAKKTDSKEITLKDGSKIKLTINKATSTEERNEQDTSDPNQVIMIDYGYENISSQTDIEINESMLRVYDGNNVLASQYNLTSDKNYGYIKKGTSLASANLYYSLPNNSSFVTIDFRYNGGSSGDTDATFIIEVQDQ